MGIKSECSSKVRTQEECESRGGHPGLPIRNSPYGLCGHKATLNVNMFCTSSTSLHFTQLCIQMDQSAQI